MKFFLVCFCVLIIGEAHSQANRPLPAASHLLGKANAALNSFAKVSYHFTRETRYYEGNYHSVLASDMYIAYNKKGPIGLRFQANSEDRACVYDGQLMLKMNKQDMTIDSATAKTARALESNSYLFHSLAMLRNILPMVINNDSMQQSVTDTLIGTQHFYCIKMEGSNMYFDLFNGIERIGIPNLRRPYYLVIDKKTYLPYQFITRYVRGSDDRDFITVTYTDINTKPAAPAADSWTYVAYAGKYQPFRPEEKRPVVKAGAVVDGFTLPNFAPGLIDSVSLHQFAGKVVLLDFWFKSCGPCMEAMPHYNTLQNKFGQERFQLLTINIEDGPDDMKFFFNKYQPAYKMLFKGSELFKRLGLSGCPSSVLLDKSGKVTQVFTGFDQQAIEKKIGEIIVQ